MQGISHSNLFNPIDLQSAIQNNRLSEADKAKTCAQQFDSFILSKILEKSLESPFKDDTKTAMSGSAIYTTLRAQILANSLTQEGGLEIADPNDFSHSSARSIHES